MENVADALKMAGSVLMFIIALSISILSFGQARETSNKILSYKDRETQYIEGNYYYPNNNKVRKVGLETVIPAIYRSYKENYKIVFEGLKSPLYKKMEKVNNVDTLVDVYILDLEKQGIAGNAILEFIDGIVYNKFSNGKNREDFNKKFAIILDEKSLYLKLKDKILEENIGIYYQQEIGSEDAGKDVPETDKTKKRVITYKVL